MCPVPHDAIILVCDARKALVLVNRGDPDQINLAVLDVLVADDNPPTSDQGTDRPGRLKDAAGVHRSAVDQTDWHQREETSFAKDAADLLHQRSADGAPIIIVAPPRMLGDLRRMLDPKTAAFVTTEINKDLVAHPLYEIERALENA